MLCRLYAAHFVWDVEEMKKVIMWILTVFIVLGALALFPSSYSILMIVFAAVAIPIEKIQGRCSRPA